MWLEHGVASAADHVAIPAEERHDSGALGRGPVGYQAPGESAADVGAIERRGPQRDGGAGCGVSDKDESESKHDLASGHERPPCAGSRPAGVRFGVPELETMAPLYGGGRWRSVCGSVKNGVAGGVPGVAVISQNLSLR